MYVYPNMQLGGVYIPACNLAEAGVHPLGTPRHPPRYAYPTNLDIPRRPPHVEMAIEADGTHPTGMHSCFRYSQFSVRVGNGATTGSCPSPDREEEQVLMHYRCSGSVLWTLLKRLTPAEFSESK